MTGQILWHGSAVYEIDVSGCQAFNLKKCRGTARFVNFL